MARRGVFGRLPRAAPDLTNTLVALIREAQAAEDSNMVDAWKNGGKVDGRGVDDKRLLEHFRKRRDQLSPDDPMWDAWNNRVAQYDFSIEESKMSLLFDQKKVSEATVAAFYGKWASRPEIQQNSEFYRHLLSQQAKWHAAANAGRAAKGRKSGGNGAAAHAKWVENIYNKEVAPADKLEGYLLDIAKAVEAAPQSAKSLDDVLENSEAWGKVLDVIDDGHSDNPLVQGYIDQVVADINQSGDGKFKFNAADIKTVLDRSDHGHKLLIANARNKTERDHWVKSNGRHVYETQRINQAPASKRIADAADDWANNLTACNGDPYCARNATIEYRDRLMKDAKWFVVGQGGVSLGNVDQGQQTHFISTIGVLDQIIDHPDKPPKGGAYALPGADPMAGVAVTQTDVIGQETILSPGIKATGFVQSVGAQFNGQIKNLDSGGWVSADPPPQQPGQTGPIFDGEGNPILVFTVHPKTEIPEPGMVRVPALTSFSDPKRLATPIPGTMAPGQPLPHTVVPDQWVRPMPAPLITVDAGGNRTDSTKAVGRVLAGGKPVTIVGGAGAAALPYVVLMVIGPDGTSRPQYRTGNGTPEMPYLFHAVPPVTAETKVQRDSATGVLAPVVTTTLATDSKGRQELQYDVTGITNGVANYRNGVEDLNKPLPLGSFRSTGAASVATTIGSIYANGPSPDAFKAAQKAVTDYKTKVFLDPSHGTEAAYKAARGDLFQLQQTVTLYATNKVGTTLSDAYEPMTKETFGPTPLTSNQQALVNAGFGFNGPGGQAEFDRRVRLRDEIDKADQRVAASSAYTPDWMGALGLTGDPAHVLHDRATTAEAAQVARARGDVLNPSISVSGIKVPGMTPMMQPAPNGIGSLTGGNPLPFVDYLRSRNPPPPAPTAYAAPGGVVAPPSRIQTYGLGPTGYGVAPPQTARVMNFQPPAAEVPEIIPKTEEEKFAPPKVALEGLQAVASRDQYGNIVYRVPGTQRKVLY